MHIAFCSPITYQAFETLLDAPRDLPAEKCGLTTDIAMAYLARGHRVTVVSWSRTIQKTRVWRRENLTLVAVPMHNLSTRLPALVREMAKYLRDAQPDVVHAHWLYEFADAALTSGVPALITAHDSPWQIARLQRTPYWWYRAAYAQLFVFPRIRTLSTIAPYMQAAMRRRCRYRRRMELIPNGVPSCFHADRARSQRLHAHEVTLMSISNWSALKNIPVTLLAFAGIRRHVPDARLILVGNGLGLHEAAHTYALTQHLHQGVTFKGAVPRDSIYALLRQEVDILMHTSHEESFCMAALESMSQGVPCVAGKVSGGTPWVLDGGAAGVLTDIESPTAVAEGVLSLLHDESKYARISAAALTRAQTTFSFDHIIDRYLQVLAEIADQS